MHNKVTHSQKSSIYQIKSTQQDVLTLKICYISWLQNVLNKSKQIKTRILIYHCDIPFSCDSQYKPGCIGVSQIEDGPVELTETRVREEEYIHVILEVVVDEVQNQDWSIHKSQSSKEQTDRRLAKRLPPHHQDDQDVAWNRKKQLLDRWIAAIMYS